MHSRHIPSPPPHTRTTTTTTTTAANRHARRRTHHWVSPPVVHAGVQAISAGGYHALVLTREGTVWGAGYNRYGQLGDGTTTDRNTFVKANVISGRPGDMGTLDTRHHE